MLLRCVRVAIGYEGYHHICSRREWFSSLEKLNGCVVIMENDVECRMIVIGTVQIKIFDSMIRDLTDVRYVPQMKKNIFLVGDVESKGLKVILENGSLKVTKGSIVMMKGVMDRNLYYLKDSTVISALTASVDSDDDATKL